MRIVFIGNVLSSERLLIKLICMRAKVVGVLTSTQNNVNADFRDLIPLCIEHKIPWYLSKHVNDEASIAWIKTQKPDVIFCFGWSQLIKEKLLELAPKGVVGFHPAALPKNRGRHPIIWALVLGLKETASTFFMMNKGADSGDIISQQTICIEDNDDAGTLYNKIISLAECQLEQFVPLLAGNCIKYIPQNHEVANYWRKRHQEDGVIDWRMSAHAIQNLIRALTHPYIGAEFRVKNNIYKVWKSTVVQYPDLENIEPGRVVDIVNGSYVIKCYDECIRLDDIDPKINLECGDCL